MDAQPTEMTAYGIKILSESETVSKLPRSIMATSVADATKSRSIEIRNKRRKLPTPADTPDCNVVPTLSALVRRNTFS